jgi:hypothetical protein
MTEAGTAEQRWKEIDRALIEVIGRDAPLERIQIGAVDGIDEEIDWLDDNPDGLEMHELTLAAGQFHGHWALRSVAGLSPDGEHGTIETFEDKIWTEYVADLLCDTASGFADGEDITPAQRDRARLSDTQRDRLGVALAVFEAGAGIGLSDAVKSIERELGRVEEPKTPKEQAARYIGYLGVAGGALAGLATGDAGVALTAGPLLGGGGEALRLLVVAPLSRRHLSHAQRARAEIQNSNKWRAGIQALGNPIPKELDHLALAYAAELGRLVRGRRSVSDAIQSLLARPELTPQPIPPEETKETAKDKAVGVWKRIGAYAAAGFMLSAVGAGINGMRDDTSANRPLPSNSRPANAPATTAPNPTADSEKCAILAPGGGTIRDVSGQPINCPPPRR